MDCFELVFLKNEGDGFFQKGNTFVEIDDIEHFLGSLSTFLSFLHQPPIRFEWSIFQKLVRKLFEVGAESYLFLIVIDSEVLCGKVEFKLNFGEVPDEKEQNDDSVYYTSHVSQKIKYFIVTTLVNRSFI